MRHTTIYLGASPVLYIPFCGGDYRHGENMELLSGSEEHGHSEIIPMYLVSKKIHRVFCQSLQQIYYRHGIVAFEPGCWRAASQPQPVPKWWQMKLQWATACPGETGCFKTCSCWAGYSTAATVLSETFAALCLAPRMLHWWNIKTGFIFFFHMLDLYQTNPHSL